MRRIRTALALALSTIAALVALATPAGAQQLVDAGGEGNGSGGLAFVIMVAIICAMAGALFFMDHVRRNRLPHDEDTQ